MPGCGDDLDEREAEPCELIISLTVLVNTGCQTDWVGELDAENLSLKRLRLAAEYKLRHIGAKRYPARETEQLECHIVRAFGGEPEQYGSDQLFVHTANIAN